MSKPLAGPPPVPKASSPATRRRMQLTPRRDTRPEMRVRSLLHRAGLRFRVHSKIISSIRLWADICFPRQRVAVFIDGCFWHGCPVHCRPSKSNVNYWRYKIERNRARDVESTALLQSLGWNVLRYWEHERPEAVAATIQSNVRMVKTWPRRRSK